ncbi:type IV pilin [Natrononativus amylolyticus]|uniref:type IV pilin n=1 Tax=Natrononativus amylolyticus TaxID=2963434 RepID=UPI0020CE6F3E|nr:type IV pilin [Natrononativus amylolyticus]
MNRRFERAHDRGRAIAPVVAAVVLVAIGVVLAGTLAVVLGAVSPADPAPIATFELSVDGEDSRITLEHRRGEAIDVDELAMVVEVNGEPLTHQPPVPFVGASGFRGSPSGPLNERSETTWEQGERSSLRVAETNEPRIEPGDEVAVTLAVNGRVVADLEATAA